MTYDAFVQTEKWFILVGESETPEGAIALARHAIPLYATVLEMCCAHVQRSGLPVPNVVDRRIVLDRGVRVAVCRTSRKHVRRHRLRRAKVSAEVLAFVRNNNGCSTWQVAKHLVLIGAEKTDAGAIQIVKRCVRSSGVDGIRVEYTKRNGGRRVRLWIS